MQMILRNKGTWQKMGSSLKSYVTAETYHDFKLDLKSVVMIRQILFISL